MVSPYYNSPEFPVWSSLHNDLIYTPSGTQTITWHDSRPTQVSTFPLRKVQVVDLDDPRLGVHPTMITTNDFTSHVIERTHLTFPYLNVVSDLPPHRCHLKSTRRRTPGPLTGAFIYCIQIPDLLPTFNNRSGPSTEYPSNDTQVSHLTLSTPRTSHSLLYRVGKDDVERENWKEKKGERTRVSEGRSLGT